MEPTTVTLDATTAARLRLLAEQWGVVESAALRRLITNGVAALEYDTSWDDIPPLPAGHTAADALRHLQAHPIPEPHATALRIIHEAMAEASLDSTVAYANALRDERHRALDRAS
jgi:hypothetical protein